MKDSDKTNPALLIDPNQIYEVDYTIDQSGKKHIGPQNVKGADLTEPQIKEIIERVNLNELLTKIGEEEDDLLIGQSFESLPDKCPRCKERSIYIDQYGFNYGLCMLCHTSGA